MIDFNHPSIVKCIGTNDNNVSPKEFHDLFIKECEAIGLIMGVVNLGNVMLAVVRR
jgi:hypothetical protein